MSDYSKLKNYLNETNGSSSKSGNALTSGLNSVKSSFGDFFGGKSGSSVSGNINTASVDDQTDSWFREADTDPYCPKLSKTQRIIGFMTCLCMGAFCMILASFYIPVIVLKARKFVLLFSLGSVFFIASFSLLWGLKNHLKHLANPARLPFTLSYFITLSATIYYALIVKSVILTLLFAILQVGALVWYIVSFLPGGQTGLKFFTKIFYSLVSRTVQTTLQV